VGPHSSHSLTPRLACGACYLHALLFARRTAPPLQYCRWHQAAVRLHSLSWFLPPHSGQVGGRCLHIFSLTHYARISPPERWSHWLGCVRALVEQSPLQLTVFSARLCRGRSARCRTRRCGVTRRSTRRMPRGRARSALRLQRSRWARAWRWDRALPRTPRTCN